MILKSYATTIERKLRAPTFPIRFVIFWAAIVCFGTACAGQDDLRRKFDDSVERMRTALKETKRLGAIYFHSKAEEADEWRDQWQAAGEAGLRAEQDLKDAAIAILDKLAAPPEDVVEVALQVFQEQFKNAQYEKAYRIINRLVELNTEDLELQLMKARTAIKTNRYAEAKQYKDLHEERISEIPREELALFSQLDSIDKDFERELATREAEAAADDLPRVELNTTKGKIVIELFENEAPETVGNFISLVESSFYDGILFHRVIKGFMAQAGGFSMRGPQIVNYRIYDEHEVENARKHFRGTVSMASVPGVPDSANAQFFIALSPQPFLDGRHTAFGRIISDFEVIDSLIPNFKVDSEGKETPIEEIIPDRIISARVLRKRDHVYKPNRVTDR